MSVAAAGSRPGLGRRLVFEMADREVEERFRATSWSTRIGMGWRRWITAWGDLAANSAGFRRLTQGAVAFGVGVIAAVVWDLQAGRSGPQAADVPLPAIERTVDEMVPRVPARARPEAGLDRSVPGELKDERIRPRRK